MPDGGEQSQHSARARGGANDGANVLEVIGRKVSPEVIARSPHAPCTLTLSYGVGDLAEMTIRSRRGGRGEGRREKERSACVLSSHSILAMRGGRTHLDVVRRHLAAF